MPLRNRNGKLEWRFQVAGHTYSQITELADTKRNRTAVTQMEADARRLVMEGRSGELTIRPEPFTSAADQFCVWADGEYVKHPNSAKRLRGSMASAKVFFGKKPLSAMTPGDLEDFKAWRRGINKVKEVTIRHDLHALSLLWQYGAKHNWCGRANLVREVEIPGDSDAVREFVLTEAQEKRLLSTIDLLMAEKAARKRTREVQGLRDIRDLATLMLNQGCRPEELRELPQAFVNLEQGTFIIAKGKSNAARRTLPMTAVSRFVLSPRLASPGRWVFPSRRGAADHLGQGQRMWKTVVERAGLEGLVMYDLRHTFATRAVEHGMALPKLMAILGHSNLRSIMRYVHMKQDHIDAGMREFEKAKNEILSSSCPEILSSSCPVETGKTRENAVSGGNLLPDLTASKIN